MPQSPSQSQSSSSTASPTKDNSESPVLEINDQNFASTVLGSSVPVLVDFTAAWCAPCRAIAPHVAAIAAKYQGRLRVGKLDVDDNPTFAARYDVRSMPTLLVFKAGQPVGQIVGAAPRDKIEALVDRALGDAHG